jgi:hypothetical protein
LLPTTLLPRYRALAIALRSSITMGREVICALPIIFPHKYDGLENIEIRSRASEVTLGSSTNTNLGHNHTKI